VLVDIAIRALSRALLDALDDVPERCRPALVAQRTLLDDAVARRFPERQRFDALVADRQGLGMSRLPDHRQ
jgi:hypothetical protein